ncbi:MAG: DUF1343 domain-containing protein [Flavobacteriaceae bacterium]|nr:DUF1343 domain-containing protein [Flavobacteriaceae bacterium]
MACSAQPPQKPVLGIEQTAAYVPLIKNKNIALVTNQTGVFTNIPTQTHLVDSLLQLDIRLKKIFAPEHGFRGIADAGEHVKNGIDLSTGLPIVSLYGSNKKPTDQQLEGIDLLIFDIQDVGARFYTYISTLHYVLEAATENNIPVLVLDRPNPNGHFVDGPVLEMDCQSFVGMHPVPIVHGMTIGEYAQMIVGEQWIDTYKNCDLTVIPIKNYMHQTRYSLPIKPSPNLPNDQAINLYPSLCLLEPTPVSIGRGTTFPFQVYGIPRWESSFSFVPKSISGARYPKFENQKCFGKDLREASFLSKITLEWLIDAYQRYPEKEAFFSSGFDRIAGTKQLQAQIKNGMSASDIRASWQPKLEQYKVIRKNYLLYD